MVLLKGEASSKDFIRRKFGATKRITVGGMTAPHTPQGDHVLMPRTYEYITSNGKNGSANVAD